MRLLTQYADQLCSLLANTVVTNTYGSVLSVDEGAASVVALLLSAREYGRKVMVVGNGGSAAIAAHLHNDLCKAVGVRALCFADASLMTALANDHGYEAAYERAVRQWAEDGDVLVAISSSGESENILRAVRAAKDSGCAVVTLSGFAEGNRLRALGAVNFYVPVAHYGLVESAHAILAHFFTDAAQGRKSEKRPERPARLRLVRSTLAPGEGALGRRWRDAR